MLNHSYHRQTRWQNFCQRWRKHKVLMLFMLIPVVYFAVFWAYPLYGIQIAFKDYKILRGMAASPWVGLAHFKTLATGDIMVWKYLWNTLRLSFLKLLFGFPAPVIFAILLTELRNNKLRRVTQTITYLPNFLSWVVLSGIFSYLFSMSGPLNYIIMLFGGNAIQFMSDRFWVQVMLVATDVWKGFGWGSIIYIATIAGIDTTQYEAAIIDSATRFQRIRYVTIPNMVPILTIQIVMSAGSILNGSFDQVFNMNVAEKVQSSVWTLDVYEYNLGISQMKYSLSTALSLVKSIVSCAMILTVNLIAKKINGEEYTLW